MVDIVNGMIRRKDGQYKYNNGDIATGKFEDRGSGQMVGFFQYLWNNGETKRFDN